MENAKLFLNEKSVKRFQFLQWRMSMGMENGRRRQAEWAAVNQQFLSHAIWSRPVSFQRMQMDGTNSIEQAMRRTKWRFTHNPDDEQSPKESRIVSYSTPFITSEIFNEMSLPFNDFRDKLVANIKLAEECANLTTPDALCGCPALSIPRSDIQVMASSLNLWTVSRGQVFTEQQTCPLCYSAPNSNWFKRLDLSL